MSKTKKVTVSMTEETKQKALDLSVLVLGTENISGYISYLINKAHKDMTILDKARQIFISSYFTARDFERETGVDFKIAAMNLTKRAGEGKISRSSNNGESYFYFNEGQIKLQPKFFTSIESGCKFYVSKQVSINSTYRYVINPKTPSNTYALSYFENNPKRYKPSKEKIQHK
jgi:hypothetical protein